MYSREGVNEKKEGKGNLDPGGKCFKKGESTSERNVSLSEVHILIGV